MNTMNKSIALAGLLMVSITACKNDVNLPEPVAAGSARLGELGGGIQPGLPKKYTLLTEGATTLSYVGQEIPMIEYFSPISYRAHGINNVSNNISYNDIEVSNGVVQTTRSGYLYRDAKGRCYKMDETITPVFGPAVTRTFLYTYNDKNQLVLRTNAANQVERAVYSYDDQGDLIQVDYFDAVPGNGAAPSREGVLATRVLVSYEPLFAYEGKTLDLGHLNPEFDAKLDRYLRIYGTFSKHLVHQITIYHPSPQNPSFLVKSSNQFFGYKLNDDGYVTQRQRFQVPSGDLLATDDYTYKVTQIGF